MTEVIEAEAAEIQKVPEQAPEPTVNKWFPECQVAMFSTQLISLKLLNIFRYILNTHNEHGINSVVFNTNIPRNGLANFDLETKAMAINVDEHVKLAGKKITESILMMEMGASVQSSMIATFLHELYHAEKYMDADDPYSIDHDKEDEAAEHFAWSELMDLAEHINIEPAATGEESTFLLSAITMFEQTLNAQENADEDWCKVYQIIIDEKLVYMDSEKKLSSLRNFFRRVVTGEGKDDNWPDDVREITESMFSVPDINKPAKNNITLAMPTIASTELLPSVPVVTVPIATLTETTSEITTLDYTNYVDYGDDTPTHQAYHNECGQSAIPAMLAQPAQISNPAAAPIQNTNVLIAGHTLAEWTNCLAEVCKRMTSTFFNQCGFNPGIDNDQGFTQPSSVYAPIGIADIPLAKELLIEYITHDSAGNRIRVDIWNPTMAGVNPGEIRGIVWDKSQTNRTSDFPLPGYDFFLNSAVVGEHCRRTLAPQNCNKRGTNGQLKAWAKQARAGKKLAMLFNDKVEQKIRMIIEDGEVKVNPFG